MQTLQSLLSVWLELPVPAIFACLFAFYFAAAALLVWLSFRSPLKSRIQSLKGVVAPFFGATAILFALMVGFLSNDIWERNRQAARTVLTESDALVALYSLGTARGGDDPKLRIAIREYVQSVIDDEWRHLSMQERSPLTDAKLNALLREVAQPSSTTDPGIQRTMLEMALKVRSAHEDRIVLANDRTMASKWMTVLVLVLITQISIAAVHLEKARPQAAALTIFTVAAVLVLGLLAVHEAPFDPPVFVPPGPILDVLKLVPA